jgi:hypothetical protein
VLGETCQAERASLVEELPGYVWNLSNNRKKGEVPPPRAPFYHGRVVVPPLAHKVCNFSVDWKSAGGTGLAVFRDSSRVLRSARPTHLRGMRQVAAGINAALKGSKGVGQGFKQAETPRAGLAERLEQSLGHGLDGRTATTAVR